MSNSTLLGFGILSEWNGNFAAIGTTTAIAQIAATGANSVELTPQIYVATGTSNSVFADAEGSESDASLIAGIETARRAGLSVVLKPALSGLDGTASYRLSPSDPAAFAASYTAEIVHLATIAQREHVETFAIGNELGNLVGATYLPYWTKLIAAVRSVYTGTLTYAAAIDEASHVSFWSQLDTIGVNAYPPLSDTPNPSVAQLVAAWHTVPTDPWYAKVFDQKSPVDFLKSLAATYGKQVLLTETGYRSIADTAADPGDWSATGQASYTAQSTAYQALATVLGSALGGWLKGVEFWGWNINGTATASTDYSVAGKPALTVAESLFAGSYGGGTSTRATDTDDLNKDGRSDLIWRSTTGDLATSMSTGTGFSTRDLGVTNTAWINEPDGDFTGDGRSDLLWRNRDGTVVTWTSTSSGFQSSIIGKISLDWHIQDTGDYNGDGKADILWRNSDGTVVLWRSTGPWFKSQTIGKVGLDWTIQSGAGDFNGDGKADVLWRRTDGEVAIWQSTGSGFQSHDLGHVDLDWHVEAVGDFDGTGRSDILWRNNAGEVDIWHATSTGFSGQNIGKVSADWHIQQTGDFSGDGKTDVAWRNTDGDLSIWTSTGSGFMSKDYGIVNPQWHIVG